MSAAAAGRGDVGQWQRLHPLGLVVRLGRGAVVVLAGLVQVGVRARDLGAVGALVVLAVGAALVVVLGWLVWLYTRYRVTATELQVDTGLLFKRQRRVPLDRVQSVDVVRPLLARVLGLAEVRLEVAGGGKTEAPLAYLSDDVAHALRARLLARTAAARERPDDPAGHDPAGHDPARHDLAGSDVAPEYRARLEPPPVPEHVLVTVPNGPLVWSVLLDGPVLAVAVALVAAAVAAVVELRATLGVLAALAPVLLGTGSAAVRRLLDEQGFTVAESPDGLRLRHGLLNTRSTTIPAGRVQAVRVREPLLWRPFGWVRLEVDVAGYAARRGEQERATTALLPVAPRPLAAALAPRVLGTPLPRAGAPPPARARWAAPLSYPRLALGVDDRHLVVTSGVLTTRTDVVPLAKVQSLRLRQGPWQRRLRLADVVADTAGRRLPRAVARARDAAEAGALLDDLAGRARRARRAR